MFPRRRVVVAIAVGTALALAACSSSTPVVKLDGSPRVPDAQGILTKASAAGITIGTHHYEVSRKLIAFSTYNHTPVRLANTLGHYAQVGVRNRTVEWLALIGVVMTDAEGHRTTVYQGSLVSTPGHQMRFKDGTVLTLAKGLQAPPGASGPTYAVIDAERGVVQGATFPPAPTTTTRPKKS